MMATNDLRDKVIGLAGLGVSGAAAYLFLVIAGRALGPTSFASLGALWAVVFLATAAISAPLELVVARDVAAARARGDPIRPSLRAAFILASVIGMIAFGGAFLAGDWLDRALFGGQKGFWLAGVVAFGGLTVGAVAKGACAGGNLLAGWGAYLVVDAGIRLGLSLLAPLPGAQPAWFAIALAVGPWVALVAPAVYLRRIPSVVGRDPDPGRLVAALAIATAPLLMAAAAAGSLTYLGAVMLPVLVGTPTSAVGTYLAALSLGRLPLFALSPLIAIAVPRIAYAMEAGDTVRARRSAGWFMAMAATGALLVVGVAASVGSGALVALFGAGFAVRAGSLLAIGFGAACWLFASAAASVAIAAGHDYLAAAAWFAALAASIGAAAVSGPDPFDRTDAAVISGAMVAAIATGLSALVALRGRLDAVGIRA